MVCIPLAQRGDDDKRRVIYILRKILCLIMILAFAVTASCGAAKYYTDSDVTMLARLIYGEARGIDSLTHKSAVAWCVLNRVDAGYADGTIKGVITARGQFAGYSRRHPVTLTHWHVAKDVLERWEAEKLGATNVMRTLPQSYKYFSGNGKINKFRQNYNSRSDWNWSLPSPYVN